MARETFAGRRPPPSRRLLLRAALAMAVVATGCQQPPEESLAGLLISADGPLLVTDRAGNPGRLGGITDDARAVTAAGGRIAVLTTDGRLVVAEDPVGDAIRTWRDIPFAPGEPRPTGIDLAPGGATAAIFLGDPDTPESALRLLDLDSGAERTHDLELPANGPPSWIGADRIALEVIRPDQHAGIAILESGGGTVVVTAAIGIEPSATADGARVAVADAATGIVRFGEVAAWLDGTLDSPAIEPLPDTSPVAIALDADGTRLAVAYASSSDKPTKVVIFRLHGVAWENGTSLELPVGPGVSLAWLH